MTEKAETDELTASPLQSGVMPCFMMATKATQTLGDISREDEDYCRITEKTEEGYIGNWCEGFGFVNVLFPFETTRALTEKEEKFLETHRIVIA